MYKTGTLQYYVYLAKTGTKDSIDIIMNDLFKKMSLAQSKFIDYALGLAETHQAKAQIEHYLFCGTQIQRNYCALYFGRLDEYTIIRQAYERGLIDARQAFSR